MLSVFFRTGLNSILKSKSFLDQPNILVGCIVDLVDPAINLSSFVFVRNFPHHAQ